MRNLFTRDSAIWWLSYWSGVLLFAATATHLIPDAYQQRATEIAALLAFMGGKLGNSPLKGA